MIPAFYLFAGLATACFGGTGMLDSRPLARVLGTFGLVLGVGLAACAYA